MIAAYAFFLGTLAGFMEGKLYPFGVGHRKLPSAWVIIFGLFSAPILAAGIWTEFKNATWQAPVIVFAGEILIIAAVALRKEIKKKFIDPYPPLARMQRKLSLLFHFLDSPGPGYIWVKRPWKVVAERIFIPFWVSAAFLLLVVAFMRFVDLDEREMLQNGYQMVLFLPGCTITSTYVVCQRWKEEMPKR